MNIRPVIAFRLARYYIRSGFAFTHALQRAWENAK
jgi:hypothetical protein